MKIKELAPLFVVDDVNAALRFYTDYLGFEQVMSVPETGAYVWAMAKHGATTIQFGTRESMNMKTWPIQGGSAFYFDIEGLYALYEKLKAAGVKIRMEPTKQFYGATEFTIEDPNGYVLIFAEDL